MARVVALVALFCAFCFVFLIVQPDPGHHARPGQLRDALADAAAICVLLGVLAYVTIRQTDLRAMLPRRAGQARPAATPVAAPDEEPAGSGGPVPGTPAMGTGPFYALAPALYTTGGLQRLDEDEAVAS